MSTEANLQLGVQSGTTALAVQCGMAVITVESMQKCYLSMPVVPANVTFG